MVERFNLLGNDWVEKQYGRKEQRATAYLSSKFCAGFRTTSRCEGINSFIKSFVDSRDSVAALDIVWSSSPLTTIEYKIIKYGRPDHEYIIYVIKILKKWCVNVKDGIVVAFHVLICFV
ncbi:hypothetical protein Ahy_A01g002383 [Arachis hypogaea]|uniref:Protein FAR1-RELATED SEQUENCE n=1 Tax=Arachis hypogaea TaxID=3818 RepID=A0A445EQL9_ARAHY|nr:hypothetical protein Ahy_A01g002383 [Arachis hypogaea]